MATEGQDKVGVVADFVIDKFKRNAAQYNRILKQVDSVTMEVARRMQTMGAKYGQIEAVVGQAAAAQLQYAVDVDKANQVLGEHKTVQEEVADVTDDTTDTVKKQGKAFSFSLKKLILWGVGAASVYRLYMKLRRAAVDFIREVAKGTPELDRMTAASVRLKAGLAAAFGTEILGGIRQLTDLYIKAEQAVAHYTVQMEANAAVVGTLDSMYERVAFVIGTLLHPIEDVVEIMGLEVDYFQELADAQERYNAGAQEFIDKTQEQAKASEDAARTAERYQQQIWQITENRLRGLLQAHKAYYAALADMALADARRAEDLAIETARRREDWARDAARRRAALLRKYNEQALQAERKYAIAARRLAENRARRLLAIERRYQDRLLDIERTYSRSMYEAIATRDATAALRAMRKRQEDLVDAKRDRDRARADVESDYVRRLRDLLENLAEQRRQARRSYEEQLAELNRSLAEQEEDLAISLRRREEDAELSRQRQLQDLKRNLAEQIQAVLDQYKQDRQLAAIEYRFREQAFLAHMARMQAIWQAYQTTFQGGPPADPSGAMPSFAEGGAMVVSKPTMMQFGEKGRELVIAQPLSPAPQSHTVSGSVSHEVSAIIQQSMAGFEGRIANAVHSALAELVR